MCISYLVYDGIWDENRWHLSDFYWDYFLEKTGKDTDEEVFPGRAAPIIARNRNGNPRVFPMLFGYSYSRKSRKGVNARVETAAEKPSFRESWQTRRCIVPASFYMEWEHAENETTGRMEARKWTVGTQQDAIWMCGLYRMHEGICQFVILTMDAAEEIRFIHDRMPVLLPENAILSWLDPTVPPELTLESRITKDFCCEPAW